MRTSAKLSCSLYLPKSPHISRNLPISPAHLGEVALLGLVLLPLYLYLALELRRLVRGRLRGRGRLRVRGKLRVRAVYLGLGQFT